MQVPQPKDGRVSIEVAGGEVAAVLRFEGNATREATLSAVDRLREALSAGKTDSACQGCKLGKV